MYVDRQGVRYSSTPAQPTTGNDLATTDDYDPDDWTSVTTSEDDWTSVTTSDDDDGASVTTDDDDDDDFFVIEVADASSFDNVRVEDPAWQPASGAEAVRRQYRCSNCNKPGHNVLTCNAPPKRRPRCSHCQKLGHNIRTCDTHYYSDTD